MTQFVVSDMTCEGCVRAITAAVLAVAPEARVVADLARRRIEVTGPAAAATVAAALSDAGFTPELVAA